MSAVDGKLTVERTRDLGAEAVVQANVNAEVKERKSEVSRLDDRINFIAKNIDGFFVGNCGPALIEWTGVCFTIKVFRSGCSFTR